MDWITTTQVLANVSQIAFGLLSIVVAIALRKKVFQSEIHKRQFDELATIRQQLQEIWFDFQYLPSIRATMEGIGCNLDGLKDVSPDDWQQQKRYHDNSLTLFYKFKSADYFLFPKWIDRGIVANFGNAMEEFAPFTLSSATTKSEDQRAAYGSAIQKVISYLDVELRTRS